MFLKSVFSIFFLKKLYLYFLSKFFSASSFFLFYKKTIDFHLKRIFTFYEYAINFMAFLIIFVKWLVNLFKTLKIKQLIIKTITYTKNDAKLTNMYCVIIFYGMVNEKFLVKVCSEIKPLVCILK